MEYILAVAVPTLFQIIFFHPVRQGLIVAHAKFFRGQRLVAVRLIQRIADIVFGDLLQHGIQVEFVIETAAENVRKIGGFRIGSEQCRFNIFQFYFF